MEDKDVRRIIDIITPYLFGIIGNNREQKYIGFFKVPTIYFLLLILRIGEKTVYIIIIW